MSARHLAALALTYGMLSACRIGWNPGSLPVATGPHGTEVELRLADDAVVTGELLAMDSTGLLVDDGALFARHPYGLTREQVDALLELRGQDAVRRDPVQPISRSDPGAHASHESGPLDGADTRDSAPLEHFARIRQAAARYRSVEDAIADGYRRLGPEFPGMGEHWVHPGRVFDGVVDPDAPPVLSFSVIDHRRVLTGVAFTRVLAPGEKLEGGPLAGHVWHDHASTVDEEALLLVGPSSTHGSPAGHRLAMVHVWTHLENPAGPYAQNNWTLPYRQAGLPAPKHVSWKAARALSLRDGGRDFYRMLLVRGLGFEGSDLSVAWAALERIGQRVDRLVRSHMAEAAATPIDEKLEALWDALWVELESSGLSPHSLGAPRPPPVLTGLGAPRCTHAAPGPRRSCDPVLPSRHALHASAHRRRAIPERCCMPWIVSR